MEKKISESIPSHGYSWNYVELKLLRDSLVLHFEKWSKNIETNKECDDLVDIANLSMFIWLRIKEMEKVMKKLR